MKKKIGTEKIAASVAIVDILATDVSINLTRINQLIYTTTIVVTKESAYFRRASHTEFSKPEYVFCKTNIRW